MIVMLIAAAATSALPPPCPIIQQANIASGTPGLQNGTSIGAVRFLGSVADCAACQSACAAAAAHGSGGCHSWVWWYPDEPVPGFARGCYGRSDNHWPPVEHISRAHHHVCSGINCGSPPSGRVPPPPPPQTGPVATPTKAQLAWHDQELGAMITFNMQTYGLLPVGTKRATPPASAFNPNKLDTDQVSGGVALGLHVGVSNATGPAGCER